MKPPRYQLGNFLLYIVLYFEWYYIALHYTLYVTNRLHFSVRVHCNRSQMTSQRVKNKKVRHEMKSSGVTVVLYSSVVVLWSPLTSSFLHVSSNRSLSATNENVHRNQVIVLHKSIKSVNQIIESIHEINQQWYALIILCTLHIQQCKICSYPNEQAKMLNYCTIFICNYLNKLENLKKKIYIHWHRKIFLFFRKNGHGMNRNGSRSSLPNRDPDRDSLDEYGEDKFGEDAGSLIGEYNDDKKLSTVAGPEFV